MTTVLPSGVHSLYSAPKFVHSLTPNLPLVLPLGHNSSHSIAVATGPFLITQGL